ncbi:MAG: complex I NDUFA9 subunit family protein [Gammaproteobacteria bacterium]|nr:complex I NDUFA9 subunit family protein [Gammaproteobacteria bacterium]
MQIKTICILGGSGFVGTYIASRLCSNGYKVTILTRNKERCKHLLVLPGIQIIETDINLQTGLEKYFNNIDAVINLVGILNERKPKSEGFRAIHLELPRKILNACQQTRVRRLLHMSALNADAGTSPSDYLRSKGEGENHLHAFAGKIHVTSFRPSVIFGPEDHFLNRFAKLLKLTPLAFPLACPNTRFAPVYVGDVAKCFVDALTDKSTYGQKYDLCGPEEYTLKQLVEYTGQLLQLKRHIIGLPDFLSHLQAIVFEWFPNKPFSLDNYNSLKVDSVCPSNHSQPTALETIVPSYLGNNCSTAKVDYLRKQHHE